ncbi:MAG TPA: glycosyl hydrolase family 8 [Lacunisphaera sp.]|nr:glycosyl hydrolase family 8 [Lacunisphaera sp.]
MRLSILILTSAFFLVGAAQAAPGAAATGQYRNLFKEYLGKTDAEIDARLQTAARQLFAGDPNSEALYYPVAGDMAYVPDINNHDVRTEGLSYAMMIAVQLDRREEFNRIWKFAKHYMQHDGGPLGGYFAWHTAYDGRRFSAGPAPDGEEWFVMALFFAAHRWGDGDGIFKYSAEAQSLLRTMLHKREEPGRGHITDMFDREAKQIVFTPHPPGDKFSDPSYHLPAFTALWARWAADPADRAFLADVTATSREHFHKAAHPKTGLMPDYSNFDGTPHVTPFGNHEDFRYDAWRTLANPALDWSWWGADPWQVEQSNRVLRFLASQGPNIPDRFKLDGSPVSTNYNPEGLLAMAAVAALAADREVGQPWVQRLWDLPMPKGRHRYYDGLLTMLALLQVSGHYRVYGPVSP